MADERSEEVMDALDGVHELRRLLGPEDDLAGVQELHDLVEQDIAECQAAARIRHSNVIFLEAMTMPVRAVTDTSLAARIMEHEAERGIRWAA